MKALVHIVTARQLYRSFLAASHSTMTPRTEIVPKLLDEAAGAIDSAAHALFKAETALNGIEGTEAVRAAICAARREIEAACAHHRKSAA